MPAGRPAIYTPELADKLCERLAEGESLRTACMADDMPSASTVFKWLRENEEFAQQYARAKEQSTIAHFEDMFDIADDGTNDWMEKHDKDGNAIGWQENGEALQRSRLRIDTRKWALSKILPKKYGDRITTEHTGTIGTTDLSDEELTRRLAELEQARANSER